jgi:hypothetical protein
VTESLDVAVIGAGGGGCVTTLTAATGTSARASLFDSADAVGGTCADPAGRVWAAGTRREDEAGLAGTVDKALCRVIRFGVGRLDCFVMSFEPNAMTGVNPVNSSSDRRRPSNPARTRADIRSSWGRALDDRPPAATQGRGSNPSRTAMPEEGQGRSK